MNVAITGSGGFIGSHLSKRLEMFGHRVTPLRRYLFAQEGVDCLAQALAGCHAVINLAGAPIDRRWTDAYKRELVESRIMTTRKLVEAVNRLHEPPGVMISSAPLTTPSTISSAPFNTPSMMLSPSAADADKPHKLIAAMEANIAAVFFIPFFLSFILFIRISVSVLLFGIFIINMLCVIIMSV